MMKDIMLIIHFLGIAMGVGTSFAYLFLGIASSKMSKEEGQKFILNSSSLSMMGHIGLGLLFLSGGALMTPYWKALGTMPLLATKLVLFLVLGALLGIISSATRKAKAGDTDAQLKKVSNLGKITFIISITIVVLAVLTFH